MATIKRATKTIPVVKKTEDGMEQTTAEVPVRPIRTSSVLQNEDSRQERSTTVNDLFRAFGSQAVGMLVGGLLGGTEGAVAGGQAGAIAGQSLEKVNQFAQQRADQRSDAEFTQELALDTLDQRTQQDAVGNVINLQNANTREAALLRQKVSGRLLDAETNEPLNIDTFGNITKQDGTAFQGKIRNLDEEQVNEAQKRTGIAEQNLILRDRAVSLSALRQRAAEFNKNEVSPKQTAEFELILGGMEAVDRIEELAAQVNTGFASGRVQRLQEAFGLSSDAFTKLRVASGMQLVGFIKKVSGAAVSEPEANRLAGLIANIYQDEKVFKASASEFRRSLEAEFNIKASTIKDLEGKRVKGFQELKANRQAFAANAASPPPISAERVQEELNSLFPEDN